MPRNAMGFKQNPEKPEPPVDLDDMNFCRITTKRGTEMGWYYRDLSRGKRKGYKEVYVTVLGWDEETETVVWRWRKRVASPKAFNFTPRFPYSAPSEYQSNVMKLAVSGRNKRVRDKNMQVCNEEYGIYYCKKYNDWLRIDGDE